jgi:hypothetical protein
MTDFGLLCQSCRLIQEFEREARTDGMPSRELADRKRKLVNQFNTYVNLKKQHSSSEQGRGELLAGAATGQDEPAGGGAATDGKQLPRPHRAPQHRCWQDSHHSMTAALNCTSVSVIQARAHSWQLFGSPLVGLFQHSMS